MRIIFFDFEIKKPFIDISNTEFGKNNGLKFCIDAYLFFDRVQFIKNVLPIYNKSERKIALRIYKGYPVISLDKKNNKLYNNENYIEIELKLIKKSDTMEKDLIAYEEITTFISELHEYVVLPEKIRIKDVNTDNVIWDIKNSIHEIEENFWEKFIQYINIYNNIITKIDYPNYKIKEYDKELTEYEKIIEVEFPKIENELWI